MSSTRIEWATEVWNPVTGCSKVSPGCQRCYAERMATRLRGRFGYPKDEPFRVTLHPDRLEEPLHWRKPQRIFVCSMGDLFHEDVPINFLEEVLAIITRCPQHIFMLLTKRADRLKLLTSDRLRISRTDVWPIKNLWLGVSVCNHDEEWKIGELFWIPAAVRFVSLEPMLGEIDIKWAISRNRLDIGAGILLRGNFAPGMETLRPLDWVICGGETGPEARPMHPDWARSLCDQCQAARVPFFFKQWGEYCAPSQMPEDTFRIWDCWHGTETGWDRDDPRWKVGKKAAGRLLDGREWNEFPA